MNEMRGLKPCDEYLAQTFAPVCMGAFNNYVRGQDEGGGGKEMAKFCHRSC